MQAHRDQISEPASDRQIATSDTICLGGPRFRQPSSFLSEQTSREFEMTDRYYLRRAIDARGRTGPNEVSVPDPERRFAAEIWMTRDVEVWIDFARWTDIVDVLPRT